MTGCGQVADTGIDLARAFRVRSDFLLAGKQVIAIKIDAVVAWVDQIELNASPFELKGLI